MNQDTRAEHEAFSMVETFERAMAEQQAGDLPAAGNDAAPPADPAEQYAIEWPEDALGTASQPRFANEPRYDNAVRERAPARPPAHEASGSDPGAELSDAFALLRANENVTRARVQPEQARMPVAVPAVRAKRGGVRAAIGAAALALGFAAGYVSHDARELFAPAEVEPVSAPQQFRLRVTEDLRLPRSERGK